MVFEQIQITHGWRNSQVQLKSVCIVFVLLCVRARGPGKPTAVPCRVRVNEDPCISQYLLSIVCCLCVEWGSGEPKSPYTDLLVFV